MKKVNIAVTLIFILVSAYSQSCLPEGITFETQAQIDNFQINYPGCTEIEGNVIIDGGWQSDITNLNGLNVLTSIGNGFFMIIGNDALTSLTGLENVTSIAGELDIQHNNALTSLMGLENVTSIGYLEIGSNHALTSLMGLENVTSIGELKISGNDALTSLSGLDNLASISTLYIVTNHALTSLTGLENLTSIWALTIQSNDALTSLTGLENVTSIGKGLSITENDALTSLTGLENANLTEIDYLSIYANPLLTLCNLQNICDYLVSANGTISIFDNAFGCNSPPEIANGCGIILPCLPYGNYYFFNQNDIDDFTINYPNCTELEGAVYISGDDITNLDGLNVLTSIQDRIFIQHNNALTSLMGLENLTSIGWSLLIGSNDALTSLAGLENLTSTGWEFNLVIGNNDALTSLTGLDNIDASKIDNLGIYYNSSLSQCEIESICAYLANNGWSSIFDNAIGCNSPEEVLDSCEANAVSIDEQYIKNNLILYPNPARNELSISAEGLMVDEVAIFTLTGQKVYAIRPKIESIDISSLPPGMYIVEVMIENTRMRQKLLVQR